MPKKHMSPSLKIF